MRVPPQAGTVFYEYVYQQAHSILETVDPGNYNEEKKRPNTPHGIFHDATYVVM